MTDPVGPDEIDVLADLTGLDEDKRQAAMAWLFRKRAGATGVRRLRCYEHLIEHWRTDAIPTNANFLFYELEQEGAVTKDRGINQKTGKPYRHTDRQHISEATMDLREAGLVPWPWLTDVSRSITVPPYAPSVRDYLLDRLPGATIDAWDGKPPPVIICEARGVKEALERHTYRMPPKNGWSAASRSSWPARSTSSRY
jgi:hypothetical protein